MSEKYTDQIRQSKQTLQRLRAEMQQLATRIQARWPTDWEDGYMAEGFTELEQHANGEES